MRRCNDDCKRYMEKRVGVGGYSDGKDTKEMCICICVSERDKLCILEKARA